MIKTRKCGTLVVISGPSGAGKGTICEALKAKNSNVWISISCTSREIRPGDIANESYFFLTKQEFEEKIKKDEFLEYAVYNDQYYGTPKDKIEQQLNQGKDVILEIEVQGAIQIKEKLPEAIFIFIMPPSMEELKLRLKNRKTESEEKVLKRFQRAYQEINEITKYNYVVVNDELETAIAKVEAILLSETCRVDRIEDVELQNQEELLHETIMEENS